MPTAEGDHVEPATTSPESGSLDGIRVLEIGEELGEYCGLVLAGLGAEVIRIEPPGGSATRRLGPFVDDDGDPEHSLHFWNYNRGKRSVVLDLTTSADRERFQALLATADVVLDSTPRELLPALGLDHTSIRSQHSRLVYARLSPFGDEGPRRDWKASDLVHLALGGVVMNCGYDPDPAGKYDLPPIAPQLMHSYAIAGEQVAFTVIAALIHRIRTGVGQLVSCAVHEAVSKNTEGDLMSWIALRTPFYRQTCRHSAPTVSRHRSIVGTKDGRWVLAQTRNAKPLAPFLETYGIGGDVRGGSGASDEGSRVLPGTEDGAASNMDAIEHTVRRYLYADVPWREAQESGLMWVPVRRPHENAADPHWIARGTYQDVEHPEMDRALTYATSKWISTGPGWVCGRRAPVLDEDREILADGRGATRTEPARVEPRTPRKTLSGDRGPLSVHGLPYALEGVRILDFTWMLASAGATRFLAALGAEVIKVEWHANLDPRRGGAPVGGRAARLEATSPVPSRWPADLGGPVGAQYNNKNPGKRAISLNVKHPEGLAIAKALVADSDIVAEGFSPGVMETWGLGYDVLRGIKPSIIYGKQSGMGSMGVYGRFRTVGPVAAALSGISEMSGLPDPYPPAGWGYSYLDWYGAYSFALALINAIHHREVTGEGQAIDASQCEVGLYLTGVPLLDWQVNGREWRRAGNRSPYSTAAPEGIYRCAGTDRWIAITCATDEDWQRLATAAERPEWLERANLRTLADRGTHRAELDRLIEEWTVLHDPFEVCERLQSAGVAAGVAQTAEDRADHDPQLASLRWLTELEATDFGRWPVADSSVRMSATPPHAGGRVDRAAPVYGEHNREVYGSLLGLSDAEIDRLAADGVI